MRALRSVIVLVSAGAVMACQTVSAAGPARVASPRGASPVEAPASFMTASRTAGIARPSQVDATRDANRFSTAAAAVSGGTKTLLIVAVIAAVVIAAVLVAGGDDGIGGY